ncbi:MAG: hypothetical protein K0R27_2809 [Xanthobacteraceae bacterium]|jgi:hypothetical protein|nr:hypothetical protein [Xanthobacteraceae bacterium]
MPTHESRAIAFWRGVRQALDHLLGPDSGFVERRIPCIDDKGRPVMLIERQKVLGGMMFSGPSHAMGTLSYMTATGLNVELEADGSFIVISTGDRLRHGC